MLKGKTVTERDLNIIEGNVLHCIEVMKDIKHVQPIEEEDLIDKERVDAKNY